MNRAWKSADIPDGLFLTYVHFWQRQHKQEWGTADMPWMHRFDLERSLPVPWKVLLAKADRLIKRGLMTGCTCGCRGDYELTDAGQLAVKAWLTPSTPGGRSSA